MKKIFALLVASFLFLQVNASVVIRSNVVAYDAGHGIQAPEENTAKKVDTIEDTIEDIKSSLKKPLENLKKNLTTETKKTVTETKDVITDETGKTTILETKELVKEVNGKKELVKKETKEIIMEAESIKEVEKQKTKDAHVVLHTEKGDIKIKLYMEKAPITAGNFLDLAKKKFYNGLTFHRLIAGFMIQGGCPLGNGTGNYVDPETKQPRYIKHESHPELKHDKEGVVAMARTADPDSASSQFFIDLGPQPFLNAGGADPYGYAVFGQVVEGMAVVHKIMNENVAPYPGSDGTSNPVKIKTVEVLD